MALRIDNISVNPYRESVPAGQTAGRTTLTPFSELLEKEKEQIARTSADSQGGTANSVKAADTAGAGAVSRTNGTTGRVSADGTLTTTLDDIFKRASEKYGVSYDYLVAVAKAESDFNPNCVSSAGAKGIMQIMPAEAKELGIEDVFDAEQNIMGSAKLLAAHLKKFDGDTTLAAAAYNAGSGRVRQYGGVPPFKETQNYVKKIAAYMKEGVKVPDKTVTVTPNKLSGDVTKSQAGSTSTAANSQMNDLNAVPATDEELNQSMVTVGSGEQSVKMTYGAYLRYLELGSLGVG